MHKRDQGKVALAIIAQILRENGISEGSLTGLKNLARAGGVPESEIKKFLRSVVPDAVNELLYPKRVKQETEAEATLDTNVTLH